VYWPGRGVNIVIKDLQCNPGTKAVVKKTFRYRFRGIWILNSKFSVWWSGLTSVLQPCVFLSGLKFDSDHIPTTCCMSSK